MKGNDKILITAEAVALMKSRNGNKLSKYFVTPRIEKLEAFVSKVLSKDLLSKVFERRLRLSFDLEEAIGKFKPRRIIDLGAGYSTFNLEYALAHPRCQIIEVDFPSVIYTKQEKLIQIRREAKIGKIPNLHLLPADIVQDSFPKNLKKYLSERDKTLIYSVGVNTYLNSAQNTAMLKNVLTILEQSRADSAYLSHDPTQTQVNETASIGGKVLRGVVSTLTGSKQHIHYSTEADLKRKLKNVGFGKINILKRRQDNTIYLVRNA